MYKLDLGIGFSAFRLFYLPFEEKTAIVSILQQHRIAFSKKIVDYYIDSSAEEYKEIAAQTIDNIIIYSNRCVFIDNVEDDSLHPLDEMIRYIQKRPMRIIVGDEEEFCNHPIKKVNLFTPQQLIDKECRALLMYSIPLTNFQVTAGEACDRYSTWFGHMFEGEKKVSIIDPYALNANGMISLERYIISKTEMDCKIEIYCNKDESDKNKILDFLEKYEDSERIHVNLCEKKHDRYIFFGNILISLSSGIDFMHKSGTVKRDSTINVSFEKDETILGLIPRVIEIL